MDFNATLIDDKGGLGFALELDREPTGPGDTSPKSAVWFPFQLPVPAELGWSFTVSIDALGPSADAPQVPPEMQQSASVAAGPVGGALGGWVIVDAPTAEDNTPAPVVTGPPSDYGTPNAIQGRDLSAPGA